MKNLGTRLAALGFCTISMFLFCFGASLIAWVPILTLGYAIAFCILGIYLLIIGASGMHFSYTIFKESLK